MPKEMTIPPPLHSLAVRRLKVTSKRSHVREAIKAVRVLESCRVQFETQPSHLVAMYYTGILNRGFTSKKRRSISHRAVVRIINTLFKPMYLESKSPIQTILNLKTKRVYHVTRESGSPREEQVSETQILFSPVWWAHSSLLQTAFFHAAVRGEGEKRPQANHLPAEK